MKGTLEAALGKENVVIEEPIPASEDFSFYVEQGIPGFYFSLGGADPEKFAEARAAGTMLPSNHSALFAPDVESGAADWDCGGGGRAEGIAEVSRCS